MCISTIQNFSIFVIILFRGRCDCFFLRKAAAAQTSVGFFQVTLDHGDHLRVLAVASVVIGVMAKVVHRLDVAAALQQNLHRVLAAVLTAQNQRRPEGGEGVGGGRGCNLTLCKLLTLFFCLTTDIFYTDFFFYI